MATMVEGHRAANGFITLKNIVYKQIRQLVRSMDFKNATSGYIMLDTIQPLNLRLHHLTQTINLTTITLHHTDYPKYLHGYYIILQFFGIYYTLAIKLTAFQLFIYLHPIRSKIPTLHRVSEKK